MSFVKEDNMEPLGNNDFVQLDNNDFSQPDNNNEFIHPDYKDVSQPSDNNEFSHMINFVCDYAKQRIFLFVAIL